MRAHSSTRACSKRPASQFGLLVCIYQLQTLPCMHLTAVTVTGPACRPQSSYSVLDTVACVLLVLPPLQLYSGWVDAVPAELRFNHQSSMGAMQALCTWITCDGIEKCRQACGGHGYSLLSGLPTLYASYVQVDSPCLLLPALCCDCRQNGIRIICSCAVRGANIDSATLGQTADHNEW